MSQAVRDSDPALPRPGFWSVVFGGQRATPLAMAVIMIVMILFFGLRSDNYIFFNVSNLTNIAQNVAVTMLIAVGMTLILAARELDLSVGANVVLSSVVAAQVLLAVAGTPEQVRAGDYPDLTLGLIAGSLAGFATGLVFGLINGLLITMLRINSFIVTLGTLGIGTGLAYVLTDGSNVPNMPRVIQTSFGIQKLLGILPLTTAIVLIISAVVWYTMRATRFGLHTLAIGSSREAAERAGIRSARHVVLLFAIMGGLCGVAALLDLTRFATTNVAGHQTLALSAIAAAVIGGTSLFGGRATIAGSMIGSLIPAILATGLVILSVQSFYQQIVIGVILIVAVFVDQRRRERLA